MSGATIHLDHGRLLWPAVVVHGGAGTYERVTSNESDLSLRLAASVGEAVDAGWRAVSGPDCDPLMAVVAAVTCLEHDGGFNAGRGSVPTTAGTVEMDAGVMDDRGRAGGVACVSRHSAVRTARAVLALGGPVLLAGPRADDFAEAQGVPVLEPLHTDRGGTADPSPLEGLASPEGTVGAVAVTADGRFAAATSTGGRAGQIPGRVGDTPVPGAGYWAEQGCAVSATGAGEAFLLAGFGRLVGGWHSAGDPLPGALSSALRAVAGYGGDGGGIALGLDGAWAAAFNTRAMARGLRHAGGRATTILG